MSFALDALEPRQMSTPRAAPLSMPDQDLGAAHKVRFARTAWSTRLARFVTFGGALALTAYATYQMFVVVSLSTVTALQWITVALFCVTFAWIALAATNALAGLAFGGAWRRKSLPGRVPTSRTALLMPVYNEDPAQTFAALHAMGASLADLGAGRSFEIFVISDTTDPEVWIKETAAYHALRNALHGKMAVWYRRRHDNRGKKAGNVRDWVTRWGARYDHMIVLDADSVLSAETLVTLACEMEADQGCGILQTVPSLYRGRTLLGRLQQFATAVYGPIVARGIAAWQGEDGNYWGHNAIIRVQAFAAAAGLPTLPGKRPFGGDILSHDFVEAALVRRAGWSVRMASGLEQSWEEPPPSLLDVAARDRRWAQGNLQHFSILSARGLRWPNRAHFLIGIMSYLASPIWLFLILVGIVITAQTTTVGFDYFPDEFSLFPRWPIFDSERMITLLVLTMTVLLLPKALGLLRAFGNERLRRTGVVKLFFGVLLETVLAALYAPVLMLVQSSQIWEILRGKDSGWARQAREHRTVAWRTLLRRHGWHTLFGLMLTLGLAWFSPSLLAWMSPLVAGLVLAAPLSRASGSSDLAAFLRRRGLLTIPEEIDPPQVIELRESFERRLRADLERVTFATLLQDDSSRIRHFSAVQAHAARPGEPPPHVDIEHLSAQYKIADADSIEDVLASLSADERLALLTYRETFDSLRELTGRSRVDPAAYPQVLRPS